MALTDKLKAMADKIRSLTGKTEKMTLDEMVDNTQKVYDAGYSQSKLDFWNTFTDDSRVTWENLFFGWANEYIRPPFVIKLKSPINTFYNCQKLKVVEKQYFDFSDTTPSETNLSNGNSRTFYGCKSLEHIEDIGMPAGYYVRTYDNCTKLQVIDVMRVTKNTMYGNTFNNCQSLEEILQIDGEIGQNGFAVNGSNLLSHDTLMRIINSLTDYSSEGGSYTITFGATNLAKLTDAEKAIATQKGWTLS